MNNVKHLILENVKICKNNKKDKIFVYEYYLIYF